MTLIGLSGINYQTEAKAFSSGGEGNIYKIIGDQSKVVKIYHPDRVSSELEKKLQYMTQKPPASRILNQVAWPIDIVYDANRNFKGFIMPKLDINAELGDVYQYPPTKPESRISLNYKLIIAMNICTVINAIHNAGYVFGDFNPSNIGINMQTGMVAFLDTDSYHIVLDEKTNKAYRCKVCKDGYVAPELLKQCEPYKTDAYANAPLPTFTQETDNFALAIHIFRLLMNGYTPFNGIKETERASSASPGVGNQAIKRNLYCFKPGNKPQATAVPPATILPDRIKKLFDIAFIDGANNPKKRPDASEWYSVLSEYEKSLVKCSKYPNLHMYKKGMSSCPWCEADERYQQSLNPISNQRTFPSPVITPSANGSNNSPGSPSVVRTPLSTQTVTGTPTSSNVSAGANIYKQTGVASPYVSPVQVKNKRSTYRVLRKISWLSFLLLTALIVYMFFFTEGHGHNVDTGVITIGYLLIIASCAFFEGALEGTSTHLIPPMCFVFCIYGAAILGSIVLNKYYYGWGNLGWFDNFLLDVLGRNEYLALKMIVVSPATCAIIVWIAGLLGKHLKK